MMQRICEMKIQVSKTKNKNHIISTKTQRDFFSTYVSMVMFICKKNEIFMFLCLDVGMCCLCL